MYYDNLKNPKWIRKDNPAYFNKDLRYTLTSETEQLLKKVSEKTAIRREYDRMAEAFSCILANLFHAYWLDAPLIYSRNANAYTIPRRYGYDFFTYKMIVRLVDAMFELGFVQGVKGRKTACGRCLSSKLWATSELVGMFQSMGGFVFIKRHDEVLYLKDGVKRLINYRESVQTRRMRKHLKEFNEMLSSLVIDFIFRPLDLSDNIISRRNKLDKLVSLAINNQINLKLWKQNQDEDNPNGNPNPPNQHNTYHHDSYISDIEYHYHNTDNSNNENTVITDITRLPLTHLFNKTTDNYTTKYYIDSNNIDYIYNDLNELEIFASVNNESNFMRRVFNVDWVHGGRFYRAPHLSIPSVCRKNIRINGEPTVELDYSGLHIRMLYNVSGIDYQNECYVYTKGDETNKTERERIKMASLIIINSNSRQQAIKAIHDQCRRKGLQYPAGDYGKYSNLVDSFEKYHGPITDYLLSGKGLELQNLDSKIMENILGRMMRENIPSLPVHDSVICPQQHEDFLKQVMMEEYEKIMGFEPVIG